MHFIERVGYMSFATEKIQKHQDRGLSFPVDLFGELASDILMCVCVKYTSYTLYLLSAPREQLFQYLRSFLSVFLVYMRTAECIRVPVGSADDHCSTYM